MFVVMLIVTAALALANWWSRVVDNERVEEITKPLVTIATIGIAVSGGGRTAVIVCAVVALVLCLIGDIALLPRVDRFIVGLGAFLLAHAAFDVMFVIDGLDDARLGGIGLVLVGLLGAVAAPTILRGAATKGLHKPVATYLVVISSMVVLGWATGNWAAMVGSIAFVVSDSILGWREFVAKRRWMPLAVMVTYHVAIVMLAVSVHVAGG